jgi:K+-transporting ATPase ATPase A chain
MLVFAIIAVFIAGLMIGRTPEYLGKKIEAFEMKMASSASSCRRCSCSEARRSPSSCRRACRASRTRAPRFSEMLYAFSSAGNNNGSAFAGLNANVPFYDTHARARHVVLALLADRPVLAIAGSLAAKKRVAAGPGTLRRTRRSSSCC